MTGQLTDEAGGRDVFDERETTGSKRVRDAFETDEWFFRIVALALGIGVIAAVIGTILLAFNAKETPDALVAIGSGAVGALAGVFTGRSRG